MAPATVEIPFALAADPSRYLTLTLDPFYLAGMISLLLSVRRERVEKLAMSSGCPTPVHRYIKLFVAADRMGLEGIRV